MGLQFCSGRTHTIFLFRSTLKAFLGCFRNANYSLFSFTHFNIFLQATTNKVSSNNPETPDANFLSHALLIYSCWLLWISIAWLSEYKRTTFIFVTKSRMPTNFLLISTMRLNSLTLSAFNFSHHYPSKYHKKS